jgi:hypothetical protein
MKLNLQEYLSLKRRVVITKDVRVRRPAQIVKEKNLEQRGVEVAR